MSGHGGAHAAAASMQDHGDVCGRKDAAAPIVDPAEVRVAVPVLNEAAHLEHCIESLLGDDFAASVHVIVADGGSTDGTVEIAERLMTRYPNLSVIRNPQRLQSAAVNRVAFGAGPQHRYLVRCDAHAAYPRGYVRAVVERLATLPDAAAVATAMDASGTGCFQRAAAWVVDTPLGSGGSAHRGGHRSGWVDHAHHAGFRLDRFREVGGYDETFSHNEDAELDHRLRRAGGRIWLEAGIRLGYSMRDSPRRLALQYWRYGRGRAQTVLKHRVRPRLRQMAPVAAVLGIGLSLLLGLIWPPAILLAALYLAILVGASLAGAVALGGPCGLWAGPAVAAMHLAWGAGFVFQVVSGWRRRA